MRVKRTKSKERAMEIVIKDVLFLFGGSFVLL